MILKALYDYYNRRNDLPSFGFFDRPIPYIIVIDKKGLFKRIECRKTEDNKHSQTFRVIKGANNATSGINPNVLWGKADYLLNLDKINRKIPHVLSQRYIANYELVKKLNSLFPNNNKFNAVLSFYDKQQYFEIEKDNLWDEISTNVDLSFLLEGDTSIIAEQSEDLQTYVEKILLSRYEEEYCHGMCMITGNQSVLVPFTAKTPIRGAKNGKLVAFMDDRGYDSYGKRNSYNSPLSIESEFAFSTAFTYLSRSNSKNKINLVNRLLLFWSHTPDKKHEDVEHFIFELLNCDSNNSDYDLDKHIEYIQELFKKIIRGGNSNIDIKDVFYFTILAPFNDARIGLVYWNECSIQVFAVNVLRYFEDMHIMCKECLFPKNLGIRQIINAISLKGDTSKIAPNLPETIMKSILQGVQFPCTLLSQCMSRIRAEQKVPNKGTKEYYPFKKNEYVRAAIIKAYLNRINDNNQKIKVMIDKENTNQGYLCGRLFATLEYLQERSSNGVNSIRSRYMNAASATPSAVFATILNLSVHHAEKLDKGGQIFFEQLKSEIIDKISAKGFPAHLSLQDQGRFMVGYYQQRQEFYTKKEKTEDYNVEQ